MMLAFRMSGKLTVIVGGGRLAASRALHALEADSRVIVLCRGGIEGGECCDELRWRAENGEVEVRDFAIICDIGVEDAHLERFLAQSFPVSLVCVTDTLICGKTASPRSSRRSRASASAIHRVCRTLNIPVNVADMPDLCDFTFCATHRFYHQETSGSGNSKDATPLQIGLTTNGEGCRLAGRLKREIVAKVPREAGSAVENVGRLRALAKAQWSSKLEDLPGDNHFADAEVSDEMLVPSPNGVVRQRGELEHESDEDAAQRRMKWVAQISEFWSLDRLASLSEKDMVQMLYDALSSSRDTTDDHADPFLTSAHDLRLQRIHPPLPALGQIFLVGSGPGHPALLTVAARALLTSSSTHLILTDKLVPAGVLDLIPKHIEVRVARKFPGNAEGAQSELMEMAVSAASAGKNVVRLKQGDPMVYGRAGEEILYFRARGFSTHVIPGISAAFAAPLCAGIPVTQRGVAEGVVVCTGVGRGGKGVKLPGYERGRTVVILMGVARLAAVIHSMLSVNGGERGRDGTAYPSYLPVSIIERASMPDQRVISSTLLNIVDALENSGEQRPPGLMVVGWAVSALWANGEVDVLRTSDQPNNTEAEEDGGRIDRWLDGEKWRVQEGFGEFLGVLDMLSPSLPSES